MNSELENIELVFYKGVPLVVYEGFSIYFLPTVRFYEAKTLFMKQLIANSNPNYNRVHVETNKTSKNWKLRLNFAKFIFV